jgi:hypothetical protein
MAELGLAEPTLGASCNLRDARCWAAFEAAGGAAEVPADDLPAVRLAALLPPEAAQHPADAQRRLLQRRWPLAPVRRACRVGSWSRRVGVVDDGELAGWALEDREAAQQAASLARALRGVAAATDRQSSDRHLADQRLEEGGDPDGEGRAIDVLAAYAQRAGEERWVRGADLRAWGMEPGPELGRLLEQTARGQLERRWYSAADARAWAMQCAAGQGRPADE